MAIAGWMRLRGTIRPWMVAVALAGAGVGAGCKAGSAAGDARADASIPAETLDAVGPATPDADRGECAPMAIYGPAPACVDDESCVAAHGAGWYCERGESLVPDGCGGTIHWPTGACKPPPDAAVDGGLPAPDAAAPDVPEPADGPADLSPAEMAQRVRDAVSLARADVDRSHAVTVYGLPPPGESLVDYGVPAPAPRGVVSPAGLPQQVGGSGTLDIAVVQRKLRPLQSYVRRCYEDALREDPTLAGVLQLEAEVSPAGELTTSVATDDAALRAAGVTTCVVQLARRISFADAPPEGGAVRVRFGLRFAPQD